MDRRKIARELVAVARELTAARLPPEGTSWDDYMSPALSRYLKRKGFDPEDAPFEIPSMNEMKKWPITKAILDFYK